MREPAFTYRMVFGYISHPIHTHTQRATILAFLLNSYWFVGGEALGCRMCDPPPHIHTHTNTSLSLLSWHTYSSTMTA